MSQQDALEKFQEIKGKLETLLELTSYKLHKSGLHWQTGEGAIFRVFNRISELRLYADLSSYNSYPHLSVPAELTSLYKQSRKSDKFATL